MVICSPDHFFIAHCLEKPSHKTKVFHMTVFHKLLEHSCFLFAKLQVIAASLLRACTSTCWLAKILNPLPWRRRTIVAVIHSTFTLHNGHNGPRNQSALVTETLFRTPTALCDYFHPLGHLYSALWTRLGGHMTSSDSCVCFAQTLGLSLPLAH